MNYSKIITYDTCNCHGFSTTMWVHGCKHKCSECFNPELWDFNGGKPFTQKTQDLIIESLRAPHITTFVVLGGEPLVEENRNEVFNLLKNIKQSVPYIQTLVYTGFTLEELHLTQDEIDCLTYLIDGRYDKTKIPEKPQLRGSTNQRCFCNVFGELKDITDSYFSEVVI